MTPERESPLDRRDALAMAVVFVLALVLRLVYLHQVDSLPFFEFPLIDARSYDEWGRAIALGDWLGDSVFYQAPAYPYFLGIVYSIFGADLAWAHTTQMVLGAVSCLFLYLATRQIFGRNVALAAGLILAGYAPALFFDGMIQKTSLGLFLTTGLLALLAGFAAKPTLGRIAVAGAVAGLLALTRENALVFAVVVPAWLVLRYPSVELPKRFAFSGAFALGLALVLLPVGFRNLAVGDTFAVTTSQLGPNFFIGNNAEATGLYRPLMPGRQTPDFEGRDAARAAAWETGRELPPGEVSAYWLDRSLAWIADEPGRWLLLLFQKTLFTLNDYEIPDTEDIYVHAEFSSVLSVLHPVLRFGVILPLALAGLVFAWRERSAGRAGELIGLLAVVFTGAVAVFYVWARYRFPLVPLLVPFAALALVRTFTLARGGEWRSLAGPGIVLVLGAAVSNLTLFDREALSQAAWVNLGNIMIRESRLTEAESYLDRAVAIEHESAGLHFHLAVLRFRQDRMAEAEPSLRRMLELDPNDFRGHRMLGQLLRTDGRREEANHHLKESVRLDPDRARKGRAGAPRPPGRTPR
jgi:4-amino-4-deoxy-L-arabinose transferase-like glycosyltransferase